MGGILNDILFYYKNGTLGHLGEEPAWVMEKETALFNFLELDSMDRKTCDRYTDAITDLEDAVEFYGFMLGIKIAIDIFKDMDRNFYSERAPKVSSSVEEE